jgi:hypothetical protein
MTRVRAREGVALPQVQQPVGASAAARTAVEQLFQKLVRKIAWGGDGRRGGARIELGSGELAGAVIEVQARDGNVEVDIQLPRGIAAGDWQERLERRFAKRGLRVEALRVR